MILMMLDIGGYYCALMAQWMIVFLRHIDANYGIVEGKRDPLFREVI